MASLAAPTTWEVNANGFHSTLRIDTVSEHSASGSIEDDNGRLPLQNPSGGGGTAAWQQGAQRLEFMRILLNGERQTFTGILFDTPGTAGAQYVMAGTFVADPFEGRPDFGWYALGSDIIQP